MIYDKINKTYFIKDDIKPYKVVWYRNDTIVKTSLSYRTAPQQLISVPNFRHFKVCPHVQRNGDIYFVGDSMFHYTIFKVNLKTKTYDRQFNLSDYVTENKDFIDTIYSGKTTWSTSDSSNDDLTNCFVMDNEGMMYIDKVYIKNFIAFNPSLKTYKIIDSFTDYKYPYFNNNEVVFLYISHDKSLYKSKVIPNPYRTRYLKFSNPTFKIDSLDRLYKTFNSYSYSAGFYRNKRYLSTHYFNFGYLLNSTLDTIIDTFTYPSGTVEFPHSTIDGQGNIYITRFIFGLGSISKDYIYNYNIYSQKLDSIQMPKDSLNLSMVKSSIRIDCSGSLYAFGFLYNKPIETRLNRPLTLNLYKQTAYIDSALSHGFDSTIRAIVYYYDADSVLLDSKNPKFYLDTSNCIPFNYKGNTYSQSGTYIDTLYNYTTGIDTLLFIKLMGIKSYSDTIKQISCDSFTYKSINYKRSGFYSYPYKSIFGCDSIHTLNLTIHKSSIDTIIKNNCTLYQWGDSIYTKSGFYTKKYTSSQGCDSVITLNLTIGLNPKVTLNNGINYTAQQDSVSYQWYRCNPWRKISNETSQTFTTKTKGNYAVVLQSKDGCTDTSDCIALYSASMLPTNISDIIIYPNPTDNILNIDLSSVQEFVKISIYDLTGREVMYNDFKNSSSMEISMASLEKGLYYIKVTTKNHVEYYKIEKK